MRCHLQISSYRIDLVSVNGPISPKQCYYEMDYSFYSFYWLDSLQIRLDHNSTYYRPLSKNSDVKPRISHCDSQNLQYKTHPEFWPSHRRIFKTSLYYKTRLILETRRYAELLQKKRFITIYVDVLNHYGKRNLLQILLTCLFIAIELIPIYTNIKKNYIIYEKKIYFVLMSYLSSLPYWLRKGDFNKPNY